MAQVPTQTYQVKAGDTLSKISQQLGVPVGSITGYRSGNPNLIYPGESLTVMAPTGTAAPSTPIPPGATPAVPPAGTTTSKTSSTSSKTITPDTNTIGGLSEDIMQKYQALAQTTRGQEPLIREVYANLAKELGTQQNIETGYVTTVGEQNVGQARATLAAEGVSMGSGAAQAPVTAAQEKVSNDLNSITQKYAEKGMTLASEELAAIGKLQSDAGMYEIQGDQAKADALYKLADLNIKNAELGVTQAGSWSPVTVAGAKPNWFQGFLGQVQHNFTYVQNNRTGERLPIDQNGYVHVKKNNTGETGVISPVEYDANSYTVINPSSQPYNQQ